jgi:hypothetical protein
MIRVWKEAVLAYLKVLTRNSPGETEEKHRKEYNITSI